VAGHSNRITKTVVVVTEVMFYCQNSRGVMPSAMLQGCCGEVGQQRSAKPNQDTGRLASLGRTARDRLTTAYLPDDTKDLRPRLRTQSAYQIMMAAKPRMKQNCGQACHSEWRCGGNL
jgi:hypothetical protein